MPHQTTITEIGILYALREMKNPLTAILLCIDLLESDDGTNTEFLHQTIQQKVVELNRNIDVLSEYLTTAQHTHL